MKRIGEASQGEALRSTMDLEQSKACDGQFEEEYKPIKAVGKGAFGFVWKAERRCDGQEVRKIFGGGGVVVVCICSFFCFVFCRTWLYDLL